jgi:cytochrome c
MKALMIGAVVAGTLAFAGVAAAQEDAAKAAGCMTCHNVDGKKMGPGFKEISAKYKGKADAQKMLTEKLASAKGHPEVKAKGEDLGNIVKWVLSL